MFGIGTWEMVIVAIIVAILSMPLVVVVSVVATVWYLSKKNSDSRKS
jgi:hypothetical protein